ncbi:MAG: tetratricopeptide repeat protein [Gemmatimonadetes bacterium]|uniref:Tetratricopeptide repeat protein n=1 Tax=Candidatus Kutchimonas denitrificans TaxID=3056748 RepID=A0AAE5C9X7_9BACT|nr:tetratricopeptide repeat protein [Gemmatimonadota bacterium]NIR73922.1 tetratricopeptide repeat protein [Candidatus Kutchimonas denitrificans]NIR99728.1 tetratricopeptide repeat protein [Gemmatimonadota bacterium]NIT65313.1 tetratricopeptide repeat protein [Gemmatimonadota bacterium]NIW73762.1 tetratricopeptide repeat protein [Gemmatimonadota bacterium]
MPPDNDVHQEIEQLEQRFAENSQGLVFAHLADAYRRAGEFAKAEGLILHGLKTHPTYISAYNVLGRIYLDSERFADAHEQFNKVLELDPQNLIALRALGDLALQGGRLEDARSWYERILQIDPRNEEAQEALDGLEGGGSASAEPAVGGAKEVAEQDTAGTEPAAAERDLEEPAPPGAEDEIELSFDAEEASEPDLDELDIEAPPIEPSRPEPPDQVEVLEGVEPVEGLVNKETMTRSRDEVDHDPEVIEGSAQLTSEELEDGGTMPWEKGLTELEDLEPDAAVSREGERVDSFSQSMVEGLSSQAPDADEASELDLKEMEDWTPGFLHEKDLTEERGEELGAGAIMGEDKFSMEFPAGEESEEQGGEDEGVVTETMAELYVKQGLYDDALGVYHKLAEARPDDEDLQRKIEELEAKIRESPGEHAPGLELSELLELTEPRVPSEFASDTTTPLEAGQSVEPEAPDEETLATPEFLTADVGAEGPEPAAEPEPEVETPPVAEAPPAATGTGGFEFADEAPVAGIEQLDPFASSFDVFVQRDGGAEEEEEPVELEPTARGFEGPVPVTVDGVPLTSSEPDLVPPGAHIEPPPPTPAPPTGPPAEEGEEAWPAAAAPSPAPAAEGVTIEDYLAGLLAYVPGSPGAGAASHSAARPEAAPNSASSTAPPAESSPTAGDDDDDEDLEQFQEWLRGLKT